MQFQIRYNAKFIDVLYKGSLGLFGQWYIDFGHN